MTSFGMLGTLLLTGCILNAVAPGPGPGPGPEHGPDPGPGEHEVEIAISHVDAYFDQDVCKAIEHVDCHHYHAPQNDEQICGTDGKTYPNHCEFAVARCKLILDHHNYNHETHTSIHVLLVYNHGYCQPHTTATTHASHATSNHPASTAISSGQSTPMAAIQPQTTTTNSVATKTSVVLQTTAAALPIPTTLSIQLIMQNAFCQNIAIVNCNTGFKVICGSDGQLYPNDCELAKATCSNPTLTKDVITKCAGPSP